MKAPKFWDNPNAWQGYLLQPLSIIYGAITLIRMKKAGEKLSIPVFCVGNPTVGGEGKTPAAIALAKLLIKNGRAPIFLSRGYGRETRDTRQVFEDSSSKDVGDEPRLLAKIAPTLVAYDRLAGAKAALKIKGDCIIMDDGFQNPALHKDISFLVMRDRGFLEKARVFPAGPLRAAFFEQIKLAQMLLEFGVNIDIHVIKNDFKGEYIAFCGLGQPDKFRKTLHDQGINITEFITFPDHHAYSEADALGLLAKGNRFITTEKDAIKLEGSEVLEALKATCDVLVIEARFRDEVAILQILDNAFLKQPLGLHRLLGDRLTNSATDQSGLIGQ